jgi:hypothetical protein
MEVDQIRRLLDESTAAGQSWQQIRLLGGEPTLHPELFTIVDELLAWRRRSSPSTGIEVTTNGYGIVVQRVLERLPSVVKVNNTNKLSRIQPFRSFNIAPVDRVEYTYADYSNGCQVAEASGIGFTPYGLYPCPVAGGIDRIMGLDLGLKQLPVGDDDMHDQLKVFCQLCGHFKRLYEIPPDRPVMSKTWETSYARYQQNPPELTRY